MHQTVQWTLERSGGKGCAKTYHPFLGQHFHRPSFRGFHFFGRCHVRLPLNLSSSMAMMVMMAMQAVEPESKSVFVAKRYAWQGVKPGHLLADRKGKTEKTNSTIPFDPPTPKEYSNCDLFAQIPQVRFAPRIKYPPRAPFVWGQKIIIMCTMKWNFVLDNRLSWLKVFARGPVLSTALAMKTTLPEH